MTDRFPGRELREGLGIDDVTLVLQLNSEKKMMIG